MIQLRESTKKPGPPREARDHYCREVLTPQAHRQQDAAFASATGGMSHRWDEPRLLSVTTEVGMLASCCQGQLVCQRLVVDGGRWGDNAVVCDPGGEPVDSHQAVSR